MTSGWKDDYDRIVVGRLAEGDTFDELVDRLDMLRDEVEQIIERLVASGIIEPSAVSAA